MPLPQSVAVFNKSVTNRVTGSVAGRLPGFAILTHTGRTSGRSYRIPVNVFRRGDGYRFALTYGADAQWVRNVLAAGGCEIETRGRHIRLDRPMLVEDNSRRWAPFPVRRILGLIGANQYLQCSIAGPAPAPPPVDAGSEIDE
jgi:deazaflavin-dependent oxidoreductase (nitroreductase family)